MGPDMEDPSEKAGSLEDLVLTCLPDWLRGNSMVCLPGRTALPLMGLSLFVNISKQDYLCN